MSFAHGPAWAATAHPNPRLAAKAAAPMRPMAISSTNGAFDKSSLWPRTGRRKTPRRRRAAEFFARDGQSPSPGRKSSFEGNAIMPLTAEQRLERLRTRTGELTHWRVREAIDIERWFFEGEPISLGDPWPRREDVVRLKAE